MSASGPTFEQEEAARARRRLETFYTPLTYATKCFWCPEEVYFYRDENGGCALFDSLGSPWPIHDCCHKYRESILGRVSRELARHRFDGRQYFQERSKLQKLVSAETIDVTGFIDRLSTTATVKFPSIRRTKSTAFREVRLVPADDSSVYHEVFVPAERIDSFPRYSLHAVKGVYRKHGERWRCFVTSFKRLHAGGRADRTVNGLVQIRDDCFYCGEPITPESGWGFDTSYRTECAKCGRSRHEMSAEEYEDYIATCHKRIQRSRRRGK